MKFNLEHVAMFGALAFVLYAIAKKQRGEVAAVDHNRITNSNQWWTYAGSWAG